MPSASTSAAVVRLSTAPSQHVKTQGASPATTVYPSAHAAVSFGPAQQAPASVAKVPQLLPASGGSSRPLCTLHSKSRSAPSWPVGPTPTAVLVEVARPPRAVARAVAVPVAAVVLLAAVVVADGAPTVGLGRVLVVREAAVHVRRQI